MPSCSWCAISVVAEGFPTATLMSPQPASTVTAASPSGVRVLAVGGEPQTLQGIREAAEEAGTAIKKKHPVVQVAVYDLTESLNKIIELPKD